jgi:hypothetical protein
VAIPGVPLSTSYALDRLDRPEISSGLVRSALETWQRMAHISPACLRQPYDDWTDYIAPDARATLAAAFNALSPRHAAPLRRAAAHADAMYLAKTIHNPHARPGEPWWRSRWQD